MEWDGRLVKVIFNDGERVNSKTGILKKQNSKFVFIEVSGTEEAISVDKIIRMELKEGEDYRGDKP